MLVTCCLLQVSVWQCWFSADLYLELNETSGSLGGICMFGSFAAASAVLGMPE